MWRSAYPVPVGALAANLPPVITSNLSAMSLEIKPGWGIAACTNGHISRSVISQWHSAPSTAATSHACVKIDQSQSIMYPKTVDFKMVDFILTQFSSHG